MGVNFVSVGGIQKIKVLNGGSGYKDYNTVVNIDLPDDYTYGIQAEAKAIINKDIPIQSMGTINFEYQSNFEEIIMFDELKKIVKYEFLVLSDSGDQGPKSIEIYYLNNENQYTLVSGGILKNNYDNTINYNDIPNSNTHQNEDIKYIYSFSTTPETNSIKIIMNSHNNSTLVTTRSNNIIFEGEEGSISHIVIKNPGNGYSLPSNMINITGQINDALITSLKLSDMEVSIVDKSNNVKVITSTDSNGSYSLNVPEGIHILKTKLSGYCGLYNIINVSQYDKLFNFAMTKTVSSGDIRLILNWFATPVDLDSHIKALVDGSEKHIYYGNPNDSNITLDVDDTDGYGPETMTIKSSNTGSKFVYYVYNFDSSNSLVNCGANVQIYNSNCNKVDININNATGSTGSYWHICNFDENRNIEIINQIMVSEPNLPNNTNNYQTFLEIKASILDNTILTPFITNPTVTISGVGSGATAEATVFGAIPNNYTSNASINFIRDSEDTETLNAEAIPIIKNGLLKQVLIKNPGSYTKTPIVQISDNNTTSTSEAFAFISNTGKVNRIQILYKGDGYLNEYPSITIDSPKKQSTAEIQILDKKINNVFITEEGSGYLDNPDITITTNIESIYNSISDYPNYMNDITNHNLQNGNSVLQPIIGNGNITNIFVKSKGANYISHPKVRFSKPELPNGIVAKGTVIIRDNQIYGIKISNSGYGYLNEPTITLEGGTFNILNTGVIKAKVKNGELSEILIINPLNNIGINDRISLNFEQPFSQAFANGKISGGIYDTVIYQKGVNYINTPTITIESPILPGGTTAKAVCNLTNGSVSSINIIDPGSGYTIAPLITIDETPKNEKVIIPFKNKHVYRYFSQNEAAYDTKYYLKFTKNISLSDNESFRMEFEGNQWFIKDRFNGNGSKEYYVDDLTFDNSNNNTIEINLPESKDIKSYDFSTKNSTVYNYLKSINFYYKNDADNYVEIIGQLIDEESNVIDNNSINFSSNDKYYKFVFNDVIYSDSIKLIAHQYDSVMASNVKLTDNYIIFDDDDAMIINLSSDIGTESTADLTFDVNNSFSNIINLSNSSKITGFKFSVYDGSANIGPKTLKLYYADEDGNYPEENLLLNIDNIPHSDSHIGINKIYTYNTISNPIS